MPAKSIAQRKFMGMCELSESQLGWLAGFVDGEGSVGLAKRNERNDSYIPQICVYNTDLAALRMIHEWLPANSFRVQKRKENWKPVGCLGYRYEKAVALAVLLEPYLVIKKRRAQILIEYGRLPRYQGGQNGSRRGIPSIEAGARLQLAQESRTLNKRSAA